jgi:hypothetical protein
LGPEPISNHPCLFITNCDGSLDQKEVLVVLSTLKELFELFFFENWFLGGSKNFGFSKLPPPSSKAYHFEVKNVIYVQNMRKCTKIRATRISPV